MNIIIAAIIGVFDGVFSIFLNRYELDYGFLYFATIVFFIVIVVFLAKREEKKKKSFFSVLSVIVSAATGAFFVGAFVDCSRARELHYYFNYEANIIGWFIGVFLILAAYGLLKAFAAIFARTKMYARR